MSRFVVAALAALIMLALAAPASAAKLDAYLVKERGAKQLRELKRQGFDLTEGHRRGGIEIVASSEQIDKLRQAGIRARLLRARGGRSARKAAAAQAAAGWQVWRPYARTDVDVSGAAGNPTANITTQLRRLARRYDRITELVTLGNSLNGVPIYAMRVTANADRVPDGRRPAVLYSSVQHAREWLAGETGRRTLRLFLDNYGQTGTALGTDGAPVEGVRARELTRLVRQRELWFILIANPDGYDYTFTPANRLWRKNLRDINGDGSITAGDGVDLNRNFPTRWNYDDEGSATASSDETYRGASPASEPETRAFDSAWSTGSTSPRTRTTTPSGKLLLWPPGWQVDTRFADEPIFTTLAGDDDNPGIPDFDPDVGAELYTTNGDTNDHLYQTDRVQSFTPEGTGGTGTGSGFIFQDVEADVQAEFERHVQFALDLARSADDPDNPVSHLGNEAPDFVLDRFNVSYGNPQTVQVNARRDLGRIRLRYRINGGRVRTASRPASGEAASATATRATTGTTACAARSAAPTRATRWRCGSTRRSEDVESRSFTYDGPFGLDARVLVLAVEDYTGYSAAPGLPQHRRALLPRLLHRRARGHNGIEHDVWDVDAEGRSAPRPARGAEPLRRGGLVHGQRHRHRGPRRRRSGGPRGARDHRSRCGTSSTRAGEWL